MTRGWSCDRASPAGFYIITGRAAWRQGPLGRSRRRNILISRSQIHQQNAKSALFPWRFAGRPVE
jgi:hypothetical protein